MPGLLLAAGGWACAVALARLAAHRGPLAVVWGAWAGWLEVGLWLSAGLGAAALVRLARDRTAGSGWGAAAFCTAVLGAVAYLALVPEHVDLLFGFGLALTSGAFALRIVVGRLPLPRVVGLVVFNLCFLLVLGELGLRAWGALRPGELLAPADSSVANRVEAQRLPAGAVRWGFPCNEAGHYDEPFLPRDARTRSMVAMIGDSFSIGIVPHGFHFTTVAEQLLDGVRVDNFGMGAIGAVHYAHLMSSEALPLEPDLVMVNIFVGNDVGRYVAPPVGGLRLWFHRDNVRLITVPRRLVALFRESRASGHAAEGVGAAQQADEPLESVRRLPWLEDPSKEQPTFSEGKFLEVETRRAEEVCAGQVASYGQLLERLDEMRGLAGDTPFAVVLIPDEFQVEDSLWADVTAASGQALERDRPQRLLSEGLDELGIPCLDLLPALRAEPALADGRRHLYHLRDSHFNARGNRVVGEAMAGFIEARGVVGRR